MFGSNFAANFGIPDFGYQNMDAQGGYLGNNVPSDPTGQSGAQPQTPPAGSSPLAAGPMAPGAGAPPGAAFPGAIHTSDNTIEPTVKPGM